CAAAVLRLGLGPARFGVGRGQGRAQAHGTASSLPTASSSPTASARPTRCSPGTAGWSTVGGFGMGQGGRGAITGPSVDATSVRGQARGSGVVYHTHGD